MAKRNTIAKAYERYVTSMQAAVGCITHSRFVGATPRQVRLNATETLSLNRGDPVPLASAKGRLTFSAGQRFRIVQDLDAANGPYLVIIVQYWYQFALSNDREVLTYHWTPETEGPGERRYPHLHVGSSMLDPDGPYLPDTFSKLHIPTGQVPIEAIVRFAIEGLGVPPIPRDWKERLLKGEAAFS